jgi:3-dehydroquinate dehydratase/shikimate dehydrogenase
LLEESRSVRNSTMSTTPAKSGKICAVIAEHTVEGARAALHRAPACGADLIELRLDYLRDFDFSNPTALDSLLEDKPLPVIITCRAIEEGGDQQIDDSIRLRLLVEGARRLADYCDIEASHYPKAAALSPDPARTIVSYHDFAGTPADLEAIYETLSGLPAAVCKIVTMASSVENTLPIFRLIERAKREGRNIIALAMGQAGVITRIVGPALGAWLTYGTLTGSSGSAPGQLGCEQLAHSFRLNSLTEKTTIAGVIGRPVGHSVSPDMQNAAMAALGMDCVYLPIEAASVDTFFERFVSSRTREVDWPLLGFSVTIPHKVAVMPLLDTVDEAAAAVGAVNTVTMKDGRPWGYNTDVQGAMEPLEKVCDLGTETVGVIGAGGAARAVLYGLRQRGAETTLFARDPLKAERVSTAFGVPVVPIEELASSKVTVVINTTPVGMHGHSEGTSPVPVEALQGRRVAYDLVYNPLETRFLRDAKEAGSVTISGIDMLVAQAALQFQLWTGKPAPVEVMRDAALSKLRSTE